MKSNFSRRHIISMTLTAGVIGSVGLAPLGRAWAAGQEDLVSENDPVAGSLAYTSDASHVDPKAFPAYRKGADCANCAWYEPKSAGAGRCNYFPGKLVAGKGWCLMYSGHPK